eukprot:gene20788-27614_t
MCRGPHNPAAPKPWYGAGRLALGHIFGSLSVRINPGVEPQSVDNPLAKSTASTCPLEAHPPEPPKQRLKCSGHLSSTSHICNSKPGEPASLEAKLSAIQHNELLLAVHNSERAKAGQPSSTTVGGMDGGAHKASDSDDDSDEDVSKLPAEEQARLLAGGSGAGSAKDARRLRRLLRNRMSAQQARERKKMYVVNLEQQVKDQETVLELLLQGGTRSTYDTGTLMLYAIPIKRVPP